MLSLLILVKTYNKHRKVRTWIVNTIRANLINNVDSRILQNVHFKIPKMTLLDLINNIKSLDATKATGLDGLSPRILKLAADVIAPSLLNFINMSFQTGHFPDILKIAKLQIHKSGPKTDLFLSFQFFQK